MRLFLFTNSAQIELVSICTQSIRNFFLFVVSSYASQPRSQQQQNQHKQQHKQQKNQQNQQHQHHQQQQHPGRRSRSESRTGSAGF